MKILDEKGLQYLWEKISLEDYPNNETLIAILNAIDETKADKDEILQSDWNQNNETAKDYIKNRPFGEDIELTEVESGLSNGTITVTEEDLWEDGSYCVTCTGKNNTDADFLNQSETFYVEWDGTIYETQKRYNGIGNDFLFESSYEDTGEPFFIGEGLRARTIDICTNSIGTHTYRIYTGTVTTKTIDEKYIPDTIARAEDVDTKFTNGFDSLILLSPNGTKFNITIGDDGVLSATEITE